MFLGLDKNGKLEIKGMTRPVYTLFPILLLIMLLCGRGAASVLASGDIVQTATGAVYDKYLSSQEKVLPFVQKSAKIDGLFNLVDVINGQVDKLSRNEIRGEARERELAQLFVNLVQAIMLMSVDPFPATELEPYLNRGIEYCMDQIEVPDLDVTMTRVARTFTELPR